MEPLLPRRRKLGRPRFSDEAAEDARDALRRMVRFVWTSATLMGVVGRAARAAAAAAAESDVVLGSWRLNTAAAAVAALGFGVAVVSGCLAGGMVSQTRAAKHVDVAARGVGKG